MTNFYDFNISASSDVIDTLEKFKFKGACVFYDSKQILNKDTIHEFNEINELTNLELYIGVRIKENNASLIYKSVQKVYKRADLVMVDGGENNINRTICENSLIDIINHPYDNRQNSGINHVLSKLLVENNITVNINLNDILSNWRYFRVRLLNQINQLLYLEKKYKFRVILTSGSMSFYDVKSPDSMLRLCNLLDVDKEHAVDYITRNPEELISHIPVKKDSVVDGVRVVKK